jgi:putative DNA primase/helicase
MPEILTADDFGLSPQVDTKILRTSKVSDIHWEDPVQFDPLKTPEIEATVLPSWLGDYAKVVSDNTQTPPAMAVLMGLSVIATCVQKRFVVSPYGDDYIEPLCIWTATILPPATRKTAVLSAMTAPLSEWEYKKSIELKDDIAENETIRIVNAKTIERLQNEASKCGDHDEKKILLHEINELKLNTPEEMYPPRLWTGDVTPERLQNLLAEHGERMSVLSDEGGIFENMSGLYSNGQANIDVFLKGHAGSSTRVDRGNREAHLNAPALSFGITIQPEVASQLSQGKKKHFRGNGTLARFLYALPKNNVGQRDISQRKAIPETIKTAYHTGIFNLLDIMDIMESGVSKPRVLHLSDEARGSWEKFSQYIESHQGDGKEFEPIQDWTGKIAGASLRISGLCHVVQHGEENPIINRDTMERSLDLCELLIKHAQAVFELMGADEVIADAKYVLRWVMEREKAFFKRSDCQRALRGRFRRISRLIRALEVLIERNFISAPEKLTTKKPTIIHHINPKIFEEGKDGMA